jgi:integrase
VTITKFNAENERIKRQYFAYLEDSKGKATSSVDQTAAALADFEASTNYRDFKRFHIEQAKSFKTNLARKTSKATGKPLAIATIHARLMYLKAFFKWLAGRPGYKSRISYSDCDYFNPSANNSQIARASRERPYPSLEQVRHVLRKMPVESKLQRRDQAIIATALLTGARDDALASLSIKHFDFVKRQLFQDAREVRTKHRKTMLTDFIRVGDEVEAIVKNWIDFLTSEKLFGPNDPAFPPSERAIGRDGLFAITGFRRTHWKNADAVRKAFKIAFESVGLPYFHPHSIRHTLAVLGETVCKTPEDFKAWSQNLGHDKVMTTFSSYGPVSAHRQSDILNTLQLEKAKPARGEPDPETVASVLAYLQRKAS